MPYSSPFEAAVGSFLQNYGAVRGLRMQEGEAADRRRQSKRADQMQRIQMNEAGYDEIQMPKIEAPPDQNVFQRVGRFLSGGPAQPDSIVMKTHPSAHDTDVANEQAFTTGRDTQRYANDRAVEELKAALQSRIENQREAAANARNDADNRTRLQVAAMEKAPQQAMTSLAQKHAVIDDAIQATGGYAQQAYDQIPADVKTKFRIGATDMNAGVQRWRDSKTMLSRENIQSREDIAAMRNGGGFLPPPGVKPPAARTATQPSSGSLAPLADTDKQAAQKDLGFAAHLQSLGYVKGRDF